MGCLKTASQVFFDTEKCVFSNRAFGNRIELPFYDWSESIDKGLYKRVYSIDLHDTFIDFAENGRRAAIMFTRDGKDYVIKVDVIPSISFVRGNSTIIALEYIWRLPDSTEYSYDQDGTDILHHFHGIAGLHKPRALNEPLCYFQYGMVSKQLKILFKGKFLGSCYAFVAGQWALLLDDEFRFDSIATIRGTHTDSIEVGKFMYTVNNYVLKAMMLLGD